MWQQNLEADAVPALDSSEKSAFRRLDWSSREKLRAPASGETTLVISLANPNPISSLSGYRIDYLF